MNPLERFYKDEPMRHAVHDFAIVMLRELAADKAFDGESTEGIQEAGECVEKLFDKLEELYTVKKEATITNSR